MKILSKQVRHAANIERYCLDELYCEGSGSKGLMLCYLLCCSPSLRLLTLDLEAEQTEIGVPAAWAYSYDGDSFARILPSLEVFMELFDVPEFGSWQLRAEYCGVELSIGGQRCDAEIGVSYPETVTLNLLPLLYAAEEQSYQYNSFSRMLLNVLTRDYRYPVKRAVQFLCKLRTQPDIFAEFSNAVRGYPIREPLSVHGFTAEKLSRDYPLSQLGAYNYLIYLRESPAEALEKMKQGLPRK